MCRKKEVIVNIYRDGVNNGYEVDVIGALDSHVVVFLYGPDAAEKLYEREPHEHDPDWHELGESGG